MKLFLIVRELLIGLRLLGVLDLEKEIRPSITHEHVRNPTTYGRQQRNAALGNLAQTLDDFGLVFVHSRRPPHAASFASSALTNSSSSRLVPYHVAASRPRNANDGP